MFSKTRRKPPEPDEEAQWPSRAYIINQLWDNLEDAEAVLSEHEDSDIETHNVESPETSLGNLQTSSDDLATEAHSDTDSLTSTDESPIRRPISPIDLSPLHNLRAKLANNLPISPPQRPSRGLSARPSRPPTPLSKPRAHPPRDIIDVLRVVPKSDDTSEESYADLQSVLQVWNDLLDVTRLTSRELTAGQENVMELLNKRVKILEDLEIGDIDDGNVVRLFQLRQNDEAIVKLVFELHPVLESVVEGHAYDVLAVLEVGYFCFQPLVTRHMKGKLREVLEREARVRLERRFGVELSDVGRKLASARLAEDGENVGRLREEEKRVEIEIKKVTKKAAAKKTKCATFHLAEWFLSEQEDAVIAHALLRYQLAQVREPDQTDHLPQMSDWVRAQRSWITPFEPEPWQRSEVPALMREREEAAEHLHSILSRRFDTLEEEQDYLELGGLFSIFQLSKRLVARSTWLSARDRKDLGPRDREAESRRRLGQDHVATHKLSMLGMESRELYNRASSLMQGLDKMDNALQELYDAAKRSYSADNELLEALGGFKNHELDHGV